jgi:hypothetical protein
MANSLTADVLSRRGPRNPVDPWRPAAFLVEPEFSRFGRLEDVATIFLTNRECPFHCVFCDLWKNTTEHTVPSGAIPAQIDFALERLSPATHIKLYNSGNFFDPQAIPRDDWPAIADRVRRFATVIVENHPRLTTETCRQFQDLLGTQLEVALGLETSHEPTLERLNKQMTIADFARACERLREDEILIRAFVLLKPPDTTEDEAIVRALDSIRFAFDCGAGCVSVIPVRTGNGWLDEQQRLGVFTPPRLSSLVSVLSTALSWHRGRVFADLWDATHCAADASGRGELLRRMQLMNATQTA